MRVQYRDLRSGANHVGSMFTDADRLAGAVLFPQPIRGVGELEQTVLSEADGDAAGVGEFSKFLAANMLGRLSCGAKVFGMNIDGDQRELDNQFTHPPDAGAEMVIGYSKTNSELQLRNSARALEAMLIGVGMYCPSREDI
ncbi:hypothetical protein BP5796_09432 [Coleophoma crateriformis]|uniref:Uncharacterized protein n=1 Tax=Coleophoma crateriformis TaxID=565419 RepID=A0A3D8QXY5_9HELO|nr:hypothetical protein BP5796_09432 [Coleophoma crateriformis]